MTVDESNTLRNGVRLRLEARSRADLYIRETMKDGAEKTRDKRDEPA